MVQIFNQKNLEISEKILQVAESLQRVPRHLYVILVTVVILMVPMVVILRLIFFQLFVSGYTPPRIVYTVPEPKSLQVVDKKVFPAGAETYYAYARVANTNADLGVRVLKYRFVVADAAGNALGGYEATGFVLPGQERLLFMPAQKFASQPASVEVELMPERWSRIGNIQTLNFAYQQIRFGKDGSGHFYASAVLNNESPYIIPEVEMGIILYNIKQEAVGANFTILNQIELGENRFFRVIWPLDISYDSVTNVEFKAAVDLLKKNALLTEKLAPNNYYDYAR